MSKAEFIEWFDSQVRPRWPKWHVDKITLEDWFAGFARFDAKLLTAAIRRHKINDDPPTPGTARLLEIIRAITPLLPRPKPAEQTDGMTFTQFWHKTRTEGTKEQRMAEIRRHWRLIPPSRLAELDGEAYQWVLEENKACLPKGTA
jgi:hypothetical protein